MSEDSRKQTHTSGDVYTHPRGDKYRDNFDRIFGKDIPCNDCEDFECSPEGSEKSSNA